LARICDAWEGAVELDLMVLSVNTLATARHRGLKLLGLNAALEGD
jgi:hypothetical protein